MELTNEFEVPMGVSETWAVLTDVERIAPCLPGAQLQEVEGDEYRGTVKVKVGPITATYKGAARFLELDETAHRAVLKADGRETRGQGNASATVTATLAGAGSSTKVSVATELNVTGKVAQFGRGVLADVSGKLMTQFATNLESSIAGSQNGGAPSAAASKPAPKRAARGGAPEEEAASKESAAATGAAPGAAPSGARKIEGPAAEPVDLVQVAGPSLVRRIAPYASIAGAVFLLRIVIYAFRRRKK